MTDSETRTRSQSRDDGTGTDDRRVVVALGGNALLGEQGPWTAEKQRFVIQETASSVAEAIREGHEVVLTHGNGPQVGNLMTQQESAPETPQMPLDVLVAETQAQIGYMLQQALDNQLSEENESGKDFVTVVTQTVVDPDDPAFDDSTKPVGPFYTAEEAREKEFETRKVGSGERPYRRVVPSPEPCAVVESEEIERLVERGDFVICAGGGGVPVVRDEGLHGVEAVVDKDRTSRLLANGIEANLLVFLTDVEHAYVDYDSPNQRALRSVDTDELRRHLRAGEFGEGTMLPKVEAALGFVESGGDDVEAVITSPQSFEEALEGEAGTRLRK